MQPTNPTNNPTPLTLKELATLLVSHYGYHDGLYEVSVEISIGIGPVGPSPEETLPGAIVGVSRIGLVKAARASKHTVDAAEVNPKSSKPKGKKKASGAASKELLRTDA